MNSQLVLVRVALPSAPPRRSNLPRSCCSPLHHCDNTTFTGVAQWDQNQELCLAVVRTGGILVTYILDMGEGGISPQLIPSAAFQICISYGEGQSSDLELKAMNVQWGSFEFIPGRSNEILFYQVHSRRILFAQLPRVHVPRSEVDGSSILPVMDKERARVFCVGSHPAFIACMSVRSDGLAMASAGTDGSIRIWRLFDGAMLYETNVANATPQQPFDCGPFKGQESHGICGLCSGPVQAFWSSARILQFVGKSWKIGLGCQDGNLRLWALQAADGDTDNISLDLPFKASQTLTSPDNIRITAFDVHSPQCGDDYQSLVDIQAADAVDISSLRPSAEFMAVGTCKGCVKVWVRHSCTEEWVASWTGDCGDVSVVCLSFCADGGLLAAGTSVMPNWCCGLCPSEAGTSERVFLYETSKWRCVGSLSFKSWFGCCLFYRPPAGHLKNLGRDLTATSRTLLVCTSDGLQAHLLPDLSSTAESRLGGAKTFHWSDVNRDIRVEDLDLMDVSQILARQANCEDKLTDIKKVLQKEQVSIVKTSNDRAGKPRRLLGGNFENSLCQDVTARLLSNSLSCGGQTFISSCKDEIAQKCPLHPDKDDLKKCLVCGGLKIKDENKRPNNWDAKMPEICKMYCHSKTGNVRHAVMHDAKRRPLEAFVQETQICDLDQLNKHPTRLDFNRQQSQIQQTRQPESVGCDECPLHQVKTHDEEPKNIHKSGEQWCKVCQHLLKEHFQNIPNILNQEEVGKCYLHATEDYPLINEQSKSKNESSQSRLHGASIAFSDCQIHIKLPIEDQVMFSQLKTGPICNKDQQHYLDVKKGLQSTMDPEECNIHHSQSSLESPQNKPNEDQDHFQVCQGLNPGLPLRDQNTQLVEDLDRCICHPYEGPLSAHSQNFHNEATVSCEVCGAILIVSVKKLETCQRGNFHASGLVRSNENFENEPGHIGNDVCKGCHHPFRDHTCKGRSTGNEASRPSVKCSSSKEDTGVSEFQVLPPFTLSEQSQYHATSISQEANVDVRCSIHLGQSQKELICNSIKEDQHPITKHTNMNSVRPQEVDPMDCPIHPSTSHSEREPSKHNDFGVKCLTGDHLLSEHFQKDHLHRAYSCLIHPMSEILQNTLTFRIEEDQERGQGMIPKQDHNQHKCPLHADVDYKMVRSAVIIDESKCLTCGHPEADHAKMEKSSNQEAVTCTIDPSVCSIHGDLTSSGTKSLKICQGCHHPVMNHAQMDEDSNLEVGTFIDDPRACNLHGDLSQVEKESPKICPSCNHPKMEHVQQGHPKEEHELCQPCRHPKENQKHMEGPGETKHNQAELLSCRDPSAFSVDASGSCPTRNHPWTEHVSRNLRDCREQSLEMFKNYAEIQEACRIHKPSENSFGRIDPEEPPMICLNTSKASRGKLSPKLSGHWLEKVVASRKIPAHIVEEYLAGGHRFTPQMKKQQCVSCTRRVNNVPLYMRECRSMCHDENVSNPGSWISRSLSIGYIRGEWKGTQFNKGKYRGNRNAMARQLFTKPIVKLSTDRTLGIWNRKANQCGGSINPSGGRWSSILEELSRCEEKLRDDSPVKSKTSSRTMKSCVMAACLLSTGEGLESLKAPELFSTFRLLAKMGKVYDESFDRNTALQVAEVKGVSLEMKDELSQRKIVSPKKHAVTAECQVTKKGGNKCIQTKKSRQMYANLCKLVDPHSSLLHRSTSLGCSVPPPNTPQ